MGLGGFALFAIISCDALIAVCVDKDLGQRALACRKSWYISAAVHDQAPRRRA
jgi:hypothetical protein